MNNLKRAFAAKRWVTSIQLDPFKSGSTAVMKGLILKLKKLGLKIVDINSSSKGIKQDSLQMAGGMEALNFTAIPHVTPRDSLTDAVLSQILGVYTWADVKNFLIVRGDPKDHEGNGNFAPGVYQTDSTELISRLSRLRNERELDLLIGCAFSQTNKEQEAQKMERERLQAKISAGADFVMTQPIFYHPGWKEELEFLRSSISKPFLVGFWAFFDEETRETVWKGNVPGVVLHPYAYQTLREKAVAGRKIQTEWFLEMTEEMKRKGVAGAYLVTPFRKSYYKEFLKFLRMIKREGGVI